MLAAHVEGETLLNKLERCREKNVLSLPTFEKAKTNNFSSLTHYNHIIAVSCFWPGKLFQLFTTCERFLPILVTIPQTTRLYRVLLSPTLSLTFSLFYFLIQYNGKFTSFIADRSLPPSQLTLTSLFHINFVEISCYGNWNKYLMNRVNSNILVTQSCVEHHKMK